MLPVLLRPKTTITNILAACVFQRLSLLHLTNVSAHIKATELGHETSGSGENSKNQSYKSLVKPRQTKGIDRRLVPKLDENDLEENFISGWGPGGQKVNKAVNCCQLRHNPTGIVVKVHQDRRLERNRKIAREILTERLDNLYNGENSVANQKKRIALSKLESKKVHQARKRCMKEEFTRTRTDQNVKQSAEYDVTD